MTQYWVPAVQLRKMRMSAVGSSYWRARSSAHTWLATFSSMRSWMKMMRSRMSAEKQSITSPAGVLTTTPTGVSPSLPARTEPAPAATARRATERTPDTLDPPRTARRLVAALTAEDMAVHDDMAPSSWSDYPALTIRRVRPLERDDSARVSSADLRITRCERGSRRSSTWNGERLPRRGGALVRLWTGVERRSSPVPGARCTPRPPIGRTVKP